MSSNSSVCQGLQCCLDPLILDPRVLMHQLVPTRPNSPFPWPGKHENPRPENQKTCPIDREKSSGAWNFVQALTNTSYNYKQRTNETEQVYIHPLSKRSTSPLSLEMCTESLGSETGSYIYSNIDEFSDFLSSTKSRQPKTREFCKKIKHRSNFPPPLTSISSGDGVQVETHREGGRLVIKASSFSSGRCYFKSERENGRLRLSLLKDEKRENEEKVEEENTEKDCREENLKENGGKIGCKMGGGERCSSRCNGDGSGSKRLPSLPIYVAIS